MSPGPRRILIQYTAISWALQAPADNSRLDSVAGFVVEPLAIHESAGEWQLIGSAMILAQNLNRLIRRWLSFAVELGKTSFARCHATNLPRYQSPPRCLARPVGSSQKNHNARMRFPCDIFGASQPLATNLPPHASRNKGFRMIGRIALLASMVLTPCVLVSARAAAQDVPGIEICTVEKTMERRTSCLQSNIDFLQKTIIKLAADHQQKLDAANRQLESVKSTVASLQKIIDELQVTQKKAVEDQNRKAVPAPPKESSAPARDSAK